ncbi:NAD(FAD)-dependent dehydrogenase, partial [filamentous cyanobacterium CCP5]
MSPQKTAVCQVSDLREGQMKPFKAAGKKILLARYGGDFWAIAPNCTHFGAPLEKGVVGQGRVVCPWHNACFSLKSGSIVEPPGRNDLASYPVQVEGDTVYVEVSDAGSQVVPLMASYAPDQDDRTFVIVGGGAAGNAAAESLRKEGYQGRIVILSADSELPYDRTALSKHYLQSDSVDEASLLRSDDFYQEHSIEIKTGVAVHQLNLDSRQVTYGDGETLTYDALLLATGGKVQELPIPGMDLANVFTLRRTADAQHILATAKDSQRAVIIGSGFIGMEVASSLRQQGLEVTVVASSEVPFKKVLGEQVGQMFQ